MVYKASEYIACRAAILCVSVALFMIALMSETSLMKHIQSSGSTATEDSCLHFAVDVSIIYVDIVLCECYRTYLSVEPVVWSARCAAVQNVLASATKAMTASMCFMY